MGFEAGGLRFQYFDELPKVVGDLFRLKMRDRVIEMLGTRDGAMHCSARIETEHPEGMAWLEQVQEAIAAGTKPIGQFEFGAGFQLPKSYWDTSKKMYQFAAWEGDSGHGALVLYNVHESDSGLSVMVVPGWGPWGSTVAWCTRTLAILDRLLLGVHGLDVTSVEFPDAGDMLDWTDGQTPVAQMWREYMLNNTRSEVLMSTDGHIEALVRPGTR